MRDQQALFAAPPPASEAELCERAAALGGVRLGALAARYGEPVPPDLKRHKGWVGQLCERALGATARSRDEPDFVDLGVELKTLPVDRRGAPCESTFVCTVPLGELVELGWLESRVRRKLARVLWLVVEGERSLAPAERRIGAALLWSPSAEDERALQADWEELSGLIGRGEVDAITGHLGRFLQLRPKAAHGGVRRRALDAEGMLSETLPRGFYLRSCFTAAILRANFSRA